MDIPTIPIPAIGSRRNEDIALDLLKFVASYTEVGKAVSVGFQQTSAAKGDEQADRLLDLYARCLSAVQGSKK